jgi:hypothetical protein
MEYRRFSRFWYYSVVLLIAGLFSSSLLCAEPEWDKADKKECNRACLVAIMDGYMNAIFKQDINSTPPLYMDVRKRTNTGVMVVGERVLWRTKTKPTAFKIYVADLLRAVCFTETYLDRGGVMRLVL